MSDGKAIYLCDPERNRECGKKICFMRGGKCRRTSSAEHALRDREGKPIKAPEWPGWRKETNGTD